MHGRPNLLWTGCSVLTTKLLLSEWKLVVFKTSERTRTRLVLSIHTTRNGDVGMRFHIACSLTTQCPLSDILISAKSSRKKRAVCTVRVDK